jgi:hypothetical protein
MINETIIPKFNENKVLPPHRGNPKNESDMSPFPATTLQLCERFGHSKARRPFLRGFLEFRGVLEELQMHEGFQWLDGFFMEDFEHQKIKTPEFIQVVTFYKQPPKPFPHPDLTDTFAILQDPDLLERKYNVTHNVVRLDMSAQNTPQKLVSRTRFWWGQMSHTEEEEVWKGLVQVPLNTPDDDAAAMQYLKALEKKALEKEKK